MRKKIEMTVVAVLLAMSLIACGSKESKVSEETEAVSEVVKQESTEQKSVNVSAQDVEAEPEGNIETETSSEAEPEKVEEVKEEIVPLWYMDEEGIKSESLGIEISKEMSGTGTVCFDKDVYYQDELSPILISFSCYYYKGTLDDYLALYSETEKNVISGIDYATDKSNDYNIPDIVFVNNGIILSGEIMLGNDEYSPSELVEWMYDTNILKIQDEFENDSLAYFTEKGICYPALGIKIENADNSSGLNSINYNDDVYLKGWILGDGETAENVQGVVDNAKDQNMTGYIPIDEIEKKIGKNNFTGYGFKVSEYTDDEYWLFCSKDTTWYFSLYCAPGKSYEDYLSPLEELSE